MTNIVEYTEWAQGQPDNANGNKNCMLADSHSMMQWKGGVCEENRNYICEKPADFTGVVG